MTLVMDEERETEKESFKLDEKKIKPTTLRRDRRASITIVQPRTLMALAPYEIYSY